MPEQQPLARIYRHYLIATLGVATVLLLLLGIYKIRYIIVMIALGGFLAYFLEWPIRWLSRRISRENAVRIVFYSFLLLMIGSIGPIGGLIYTQGDALVRNFPQYLESVEAALQAPELTLPFGISVNIQEQLQNAVEALQANSGTIANRLIAYLQTFASGTAAVIGALLFIPLIALYFLMDGERLRKALVDCFNPDWRDEVDQALTAVSQSLGGYVYGKTVTSIIAGVLTTIALYIIGIPYALILGLLVLISENIPIVGNLIAFVPIAIIAFANDPVDLIWVIVITLIIQAFQNYVIVPRMMGESMNLHPMTVLVSLLAGGTLAGLPGMILALPVAAAVKIILNVFVWHREERGIPAQPLITWRKPRRPEDESADGGPGTVGSQVIASGSVEAADKSVVVNTTVVASEAGQKSGAKPVVPPEAVQEKPVKASPQSTGDKAHAGGSGEKNKANQSSRRRKR